METRTETLTRKRGGAKYNPLHLGLLILSTLLLTVAAVFLIQHMNVAGIICMILGIVVRYIDGRI